MESKHAPEPLRVPPNFKGKIPPLITSRLIQPRVNYKCPRKDSGKFEQNSNRRNSKCLHSDLNSFCDWCSFSQIPKPQKTKSVANLDTAFFSRSISSMNLKPNPISNSQGPSQLPSNEMPSTARMSAVHPPLSIDKNKAHSKIPGSFINAFPFPESNRSQSLKTQDFSFFKRISSINPNPKSIEDKKDSLIRVKFPNVSTIHSIGEPKNIMENTFNKTSGKLHRTKKIKKMGKNEISKFKGRAQFFQVNQNPNMFEEKKQTINQLKNDISIETSPKNAHHQSINNANDIFKSQNQKKLFSIRLVDSNEKCRLSKKFKSNLLYADNNLKNKYLRIDNGQICQNPNNFRILPIKDYIKSELEGIEQNPLSLIHQKLAALSRTIERVSHFQIQPRLDQFIKPPILTPSKGKENDIKVVNKNVLSKSQMKVIQEEQTPQKEISSELKSKKSGSKSSKSKQKSALSQTRKIKTISIPTSSKKKNYRRNVNKSKRCHCSQSRCLRLHCVCFKNQVLCSPECGCIGCLNNEANKDLVEKIHKETQEINPHAFELRIIEVTVNKKKVRITRGCKCSKNNCNKNYCECKRLGVVCSSACDCKTCFNNKISIDADLARELSKRKNRKKRKINLLEN